MSHFSRGVAALASRLPDALDAADRAHMESLAERLRSNGVPDATALRVASLDPLFAALDIVEVASAKQQPVERVAGIYFDLATRLGLPELRDQIAALPADQHWQGLARGAMLDDLASLQCAITGEALNGFDESVASDKLVGVWQSRNQRAIERTQQLLAELKNAPTMDVSMLSVALRELRHLA